MRYLWVIPALSCVCLAGADTNVTALTDNLSATWGEVKTVLVALLGFGFAVWALMKVKKYGK